VSQPIALVLNVGSGYRAPSVYDLYANGVHEGSLAFDRGNPDLTNEQSLNTDLALRWQSTSLAFEIGGFVNLISNFIYSVPLPGEIDSASGFQVYQSTQGNATLTGFEASAKWHPYQFLHLQGTADYVWGQNRSLDQPLPNMPPFRATWSVQVEAKGSKLFTAPYALFSGEVNAQQTRLNPDEAVFFATAFDGAGFTPMAYALLNLGAGVSIAGSSSPVHLDVTLRNLLDTPYSPSLSRNNTVAPMPGMGRSLLVSVSTTFGRM
jgi:outer membrane receptor protein involved in Fe transport